MGGPHIDPNSTALIIRAATKRTPSFKKQPAGHEEPRYTAQALSVLLRPRDTGWLTRGHPPKEAQVVARTWVRGQKPGLDQTKPDVYLVTTTITIFVVIAIFVVVAVIVISIFNIIISIILIIVPDKGMPVYPGRALRGWFS